MTREHEAARPALGGLRLVADAAPGPEPDGPPAVACTLGDGEAFAARIEAARSLFAACTAVEEVPDGYAFHFPGDEPTAAALLAFVAAERRCCRFLAYELGFAPGRGPAVLRLRGDADGKRFVVNAFVPPPAYWPGAGVADPTRAAAPPVGGRRLPMVPRARRAAPRPGGRVHSAPRPSRAV